MKKSDWTSLNCLERHTVIAEIFVWVKVSYTSVLELLYAINFRRARTVSHTLVCVHAFRVLLNFMLSAKRASKTKLNRLRKFLSLQFWIKNTGRFTSSSSLLIVSPQVISSLSSVCLPVCLSLQLSLSLSLSSSSPPKSLPACYWLWLRAGRRKKEQTPRRETTSEQVVLRHKDRSCFFLQRRLSKTFTSVATCCLQINPRTPGPPQKTVTILCLLFFEILSDLSQAVRNHLADESQTLSPDTPRVLCLLLFHSSPRLSCFLSRNKNLCFLLKLTLPHKCTEILQTFSLGLFSAIPVPNGQNRN